MAVLIPNQISQHPELDLGLFPDDIATLEQNVLSCLREELLYFGRQAAKNPAEFREKQLYGFIQAAITVKDTQMDYFADYGVRAKETKFYQTLEEIRKGYQLINAFVYENT